MRTVEATDWAYLAALIDGEGCISANKQHAPKYHASVRVVNTDRRMLEWIVETFQIGIVTVNRRHRSPTNWKWLYKWWVGGTIKLPYVLEGVMPFLVIKKEQAEIALELTLRPNNKRQKAIYLELQELKH